MDGQASIEPNDLRQCATEACENADEQDRVNTIGLALRLKKAIRLACEYYSSNSF
jgi:hypothetical protein